MNKFDKCKKCAFNKNPSHVFPCDKCDGVSYPVTCRDCRTYFLASNDNKCKKGFRPCKEFEWS